MIDPQAYLHFLHHTHVFASTVQEILEKKYLRETTKLEITVPQFNLLRLLTQNGRHHVGEMASLLGVSKAAASKNVDKLVRLKLVTREVKQEDRRAISLNLTARGKNVIRKYEELKEERLKAALQDLTTKELDTLMQGLEKVSLLIMEGEQENADLCMKCSAYYVDHCPLRTLSRRCIYLKNRKHVID